jgi:hypothetical protein
VPKRRNQDRRQLALELEPPPPTPLPAPRNTKGLIETLADLLLEALGERTTGDEASEGGSHEPQSHR